MRNFLLFTIYAPLASWGDIAVGEARGSWDRPSRSAILGLIAGALGLTRDDETAHGALDAGYGIAVRLDARGAPLVDYHTAQTVSASAVRRQAPATRGAALRAAERETILSRRTYYQDALATIAVWTRNEAHWPLDALAAALRSPRFTPYAGRKANAVGAPFAPHVVLASTIAEALAQRADPVPSGIDGRLLRPRAGWGREVMHDICEFDSGLGETRRVVRRDGSPDRSRWLFAERVAVVGVLPSRESI